MRLPIVKVKDDNDGYYIINESDFNENIHELFEQSLEVKEGSVDWYKQKLDEMKVEYSPSDKKKELKELYNSNIQD